MRVVNEQPTESDPAPAAAPPRRRRGRRVLAILAGLVIFLAALVALTPVILTSIDWPELVFDLSEQLKDTPEGLFPDKQVRVRLALSRGRNSDYELRARGTLLGWPFSAMAAIDLDSRWFAVTAHAQAQLKLGSSALALTARVDADTSGAWQADVELPPTALTERDPLLADLLARANLADVTNLAFDGRLSLTAHAERTQEVPVPKWTARGRLQDFNATFTTGGQNVAVANLRLPFGAAGLADHVDLAPIFLRADRIDAAGFTLTEPFASLRATERALLVTEAGAGCCGGDIRLYSLFLDLSRLNMGLTLFVDGIDTGEALQHLNGFAGEASGRLHGRIPVRLVNGRRVKLQDAYLYSVPGEVGNLRLRDATPITRNLAAAGVDAATQDNLARALANLDYTVLRLALRPEENGEERGKLALEIKIEGTAASGGVTVPVSLTVTFHDDIERLINTGLKVTSRSKHP